MAKCRTKFSEDHRLNTQDFRELILELSDQCDWTEGTVLELIFDFLEEETCIHKAIVVRLLKYFERIREEEDSLG